MKKNTYKWMNCLYGVLSGLCFGLMIVISWEFFDLMPAMLYMIVLKQMKLLPMIGKAHGFSTEPCFVWSVFGSLLCPLFKAFKKTSPVGVGYGNR